MTGHDVGFNFSMRRLKFPNVLPHQEQDFAVDGMTVIFGDIRQFLVECSVHTDP